MSTQTKRALNRKHEATVPLLGVLLFLTLLSFLTFRDISPQASDRLLVIRSMATFMVIGLGAGVLFLAGSIRREFLRPFVLYLLYVFACFIPNLVHGPDAKSLYFTISLFGPFTFYYLIYIRYGFSSVDSVRILWTGFYPYYILILVSVLMSVLIYPDWALRLAFDGRLQSVFLAIGANGLSWISFIIPLLSLLCHPGRKTRFLILAAICLVIMTLTQTRTTFVSLFLAGLYYLFIKRRFWLLGTLVFLGALFLVIMGSDLLLVFSRGETQFTTLSGRTLMWELVITQILNNPWFGLGLWRGAHVALQASQFDFVSQPHNAILEVLVSAGFFGFFFWLAVLLQFRYAFQIKISAIKSGALRTQVIALRLICVSYIPKLVTSSEFVLVDYSFYLLLGLIFIQEAILHEVKRQRGVVPDRLSGDRQVRTELP